MDFVKQRFKEKVNILAAEIKDLQAEHGKMQIDTVDISQAFGGMRDITSMIWETSLLDAQDGIRFRGYSIPQLQELLPKAPNGEEPLPEGLFYLMLIGELPTQADVDFIASEWQRRSNIPPHVFKTIDVLPITAHPMTQFISAISAMQTESIFSSSYLQGMSKSDYWDAIL